MKIPSDVRINGIDYPVVYEARLNDGAHICHGQSLFDDCLIKLNPDSQAQQKQCVTLWHEILHILIDNAKLTIEDEERVVTALSSGIYQVLQDNGRKLFDLTTSEVHT